MVTIANATSNRSIRRSGDFVFMGYWRVRAFGGVGQENPESGDRSAGKRAGCMPETTECGEVFDAAVPVGLGRKTPVMTPRKMGVGAPADNPFSVKLS